MKKLLTLFAVALFSSTAFSATNLANITGYDLTGSYANGTSGLNYTYSGTTSNGIPGVFNYINGTGTLADGNIQNANAGHMFLMSSTSNYNFLR